MSDSFRWRGRMFTWRSGTSPPQFSTEDSPGASFNGSCKPEGRRWYASIRINGGHTGAYAETPEKALEAALDGWRQAVEIVTGTEP